MLMIILYDSGNSIDEVISSLQESAETLSQWFSYNQMKRNTDKCYLIVNTIEPIEIRIGESLIKSSTCEKLLVIKIVIINLLGVILNLIFILR